jgi:hypothetical protein
MEYQNNDIIELNDHTYLKFYYAKDDHGSSCCGWSHFDISNNIIKYYDYDRFRVHYNSKLNGDGYEDEFYKMLEERAPRYYKKYYNDIIEEYIIFEPHINNNFRGGFVCYCPETGELKSSHDGPYGVKLFKMMWADRKIQLVFPGCYIEGMMKEDFYLNIESLRKLNAIE